MTKNKETVERYMEGFRRGDHAMVLSCLTDDVVWDLPGLFHLVGKDAFDREMGNEAFVGLPAIRISRVVEEHDVVIAEGDVRSQRRDGTPFAAVFCDVFEMRNGLIKRLVSYLMETKQPIA